MTSSDSGDKAARIERIRAIVNEDYERISGTEDPYVILNLGSDATWDEAASRYERYERFYRAENFQRLGDMELTRKALDIRRAVGRAIVEIQATLEEEHVTDMRHEPAQLADLDPSSAALGDVYFRDGLTYLKLGDLQEAAECFRRACDYDPTRGLPLAYLAYSTFRRRMNDPDVVAEARKSIAQAVRMEPNNADVHVLVARFYLKIGEDDAAKQAVARIEELDAEHPKLDKLHRRLQA